MLQAATWHVGLVSLGGTALSCPCPCISGQLQPWGGWLAGRRMLDSAGCAQSRSSRAALLCVPSRNACVCLILFLTSLFVFVLPSVTSLSLCPCRAALEGVFSLFLLQSAVLLCHAVVEPTLLSSLITFSLYLSSFCGRRCFSYCFFSLSSPPTLELAVCLP